MSKAEELIQKAKVQLVLHQPFFASLVCKRSIELMDNEKFTASMNASGDMKLGRKFVEGLNVQQLTFLMAHETMHYAMMHPMRRGWRNHKKFNKVCDYVINDLLKASGMTEPPHMAGCFKDGARDHCAEELYDLEEDSDGDDDGQGQGGGQGEGQGKGKGDGQGDGDGSGNGNDGHQPGNGTDDLDESSGGGEQNESELQEQVRQELAQAAQAAKAVGKLPAGLERLVDELINPPTPWQQLLERWMTQFQKGDITWARPRKNFMEVGYFPTAGKKASMGTIGVIMDTSGSISREIPHFAGHMNAILETCAPEKVIFLHVDARVNHVEEYTIEDFPIQIDKAYGGGGTDMMAGIDYFLDNDIELDACVILTDGYSSWGKAPYFPTAVLCTTDVEVPFGEVIRYQMET